MNYKDMNEDPFKFSSNLNETYSDNDIIKSAIDNIYTLLKFTDERLNDLEKVVYGHLQKTNTFGIQRRQEKGFK